MNKEDPSLPPAVYLQAMNTLGENLLNSLISTMRDLPSPLQTTEVAFQGIGAFLTNVLRQNCPKDPEAQQQMLERIMKLVQAHLNETVQPS